MLDPATAFSVACGAFDLAGFAIEMAIQCREVYKSPSRLTAEQDDLLQSAEVLQKITSQMQTRLESLPSTSQLSTEHQHIVGVAQECSEASQELQDALDQLRAKRENDCCAAIKAQLKYLWYNRSVEQTVSKLRICQANVNTAMLGRLSEQVDLSSGVQRETIQKLQLQSIEQRQSHQEFHGMIQKLMEKLESSQKSVEDGNKQLNDKIEQKYHEFADGHWFDQVLKSLSFSSMTLREETIEKAYENTFDWIFRAEEHTLRPGHDFVKWLREGSGVYWIYGKAGSGKSTLMRFIADKPDLGQHLALWKTGSDLIVAKHFFWAMGDEKQHDILGLLRSLLVQLLQACPAFVEALQLSPRHEIPVWSEERLFAGIETIAKSVENTSPGWKIFILIDGLDEFGKDDSQRLELANFIKKLTKASAVKLCVASRPELVFLKAFQNRQLRIHDLTRKDMETYIRGQLTKMRHYERFHEQNEHSVERLINMTIKKADGVFLWASLVTRDLMTGMSSGDSIDEMFKRLHRAEGSLNGLFRQKLDRIDEIYRPHSAKYLKMLMMVSKEANRFPGVPQNDLLTFLFMSQPEVRHLFPSKTSNLFTVPDTYKRLIDSLRKLRGHLITRCAGLITVDDSKCVIASKRNREKAELELQTNGTTGGSTPEHYETAIKQLCASYYFDSNVNFIHRSAQEFLCTNEDAKKLLMSTTYDRNAYIRNGTQFILTRTFCPFLGPHGGLRVVKSYDDMTKKEWRTWLWHNTWTMQAFVQAQNEIDFSDGQTLLHDFNDTCQYIFDTYVATEPSQNWIPLVSPSSKDLAGLAIWLRLYEYVWQDYQSLLTQHNLSDLAQLLKNVHFWDLFRRENRSVALEKILLQLLEDSTRLGSHDFRAQPLGILGKWEIVVCRAAEVLPCDDTDTIMVRRIRDIYDAYLSRGAKFGFDRRRKLLCKPEAPETDWKYLCLSHGGRTVCLIDSLLPTIERLQDRFHLDPDDLNPPVFLFRPRQDGEANIVMAVVDDNARRLLGHAYFTIHGGKKWLATSLEQGKALGKLVQRCEDLLRIKDTYDGRNHYDAAVQALTAESKKMWTLAEQSLDAPSDETSLD